MTAGKQSTQEEPEEGAQDQIQSPSSQPQDALPPHRPHLLKAHSTMDSSTGEAIDEVTTLKIQSLLHESLNSVSLLQES